LLVLAADARHVSIEEDEREVLGLFAAEFVETLDRRA